MSQLSVSIPANCPVNQPSRWPFPPRKPVAPRRAGVSAGRRQRTQVRKTVAAGKEGNMSKLAMLADIALVAAWAGAIPAFMWLGAAAGF